MSWMLGWCRGWRVGPNERGRSGLATADGAGACLSVDSRGSQQGADIPVRDGHCRLTQCGGGLPRHVNSAA